MRRKAAFVTVLSSVMMTAFLISAQAKELPLLQDGTSLTVPDDLNGYVFVQELGNIGLLNPVYETDLLYVAMPEEDYRAVTEDENPAEEEMEDCEKRTRAVFTILSVKDGGDLNTVLDELGDEAKEEYFVGSRTTGDFTHFLYMMPVEEYPEDVEDVYREELASLSEEATDIFENSSLGDIYDPQFLKVGEKVSFETTDLDGNPVSSGELFGSHKVTMVNLWTTWCGFCREEMSELEAINSVLADYDAAVVGILADGTSDEKVAKGKAILEEEGVTYTNLVPPEGLESMFPTGGGFPTNYFVNEEGEIVGTPYSFAIVDESREAVYKMITDAAGVDYEEFRKAVENTLYAEEGEVSDTEAEAAGGEDDSAEGFTVEANDAGVYRIFIVDEDGKAIPEATVQFCTDTQCMMKETDEDGMASFDNKPGAYTVHVLEAPDGYLYDDGIEYSLPAQWSDLTITLGHE